MSPVGDEPVGASCCFDKKMVTVSPPLTVTVPIPLTYKTIEEEETYLCGFVQHFIHHTQQLVCCVWLREEAERFPSGCLRKLEFLC